ncbi:GDP-mannose pyrophosphatase, partial [Pseudomonas ogarae]
MEWVRTQVTATKDRGRIKHVEDLPAQCYVRRKTTNRSRARDSPWRGLTRETYGRGSGATSLLDSKTRQNVVLARQFRFPAFVNGHDGLLVETCAGLLD